MENYVDYLTLQTEAFSQLGASRTELNGDLLVGKYARNCTKELWRCGQRKKKYNRLNRFRGKRLGNNWMDPSDGELKVNNNYPCSTKYLYKTLCKSLHNVIISSFYRATPAFACTRSYKKQKTVLDLDFFPSTKLQLRHTTALLWTEYAIHMGSYIVVSKPTSTKYPKKT